MPARRAAARIARASRPAAMVITAVVLAATFTACGTRPARGSQGAPRHGPEHAVLTTTFRLPSGVLGLAADGGAAWVTTGNGVLRIDARTDRASQVFSSPGASLTSVAFGASSVWVSGADGILRVDPVAGKVLARIKVGVVLSSLSFGDGALWAATRTARGFALVRIDPARNAISVTPLEAGKIAGLAAGEGAVWISVAMPPSAGLLRVDPATGRIVRRISGDHLFGQVAVGDGAVWASDGAAVARIDPRTDRVTATAPLLSPLPAAGPSPILNGSGLLAAAPGVVWVTRAASARNGSVLRIDPRTGRFTGAGLRIGPEPQAVAASGSTAWVVTAQGLTRLDLVTCARVRCARPAPRASLPSAPAPVWLDSLQMVSARDGWALAWTLNPASPAPAVLVPLHTADGGHTWTAVTPARAKPLLVPDRSNVILLAVSASRAWLAVTLARSEANYGTRPAITEVFGTADGGRFWTRSAPIRAPGVARWLDFTDPAHGWLLQDLGAAMGQNAVQLYRTSDGGRHWSPIARTPRLGRAASSVSGLAVACDKTGIAFATTTDGWLTSGCFRLADAVLVSHDGGARWSPQELPVPTDACMPDSCLISPPQFFGRTGFLTIAHGTTAPYLLVSQDTGATWHKVAVPQAGVAFGLARFFDARHGLFIPAAAQDTPGRVFYVTVDGGRTWTAIRQGIRFQPGTTVDYVSPEAGFAWNPSTAGPAPIGATINGGRTWTSYLPSLVPVPPG